MRLRAPNFKGEHMTTIFKKMTVALGIVLIGTILTASASAECGDTKLKRQHP